MAQWLTRRGYQVRVIAAPPYYPAWKVAEGHSAWRYGRQTMSGVEVYRCPLWVPKATSGPARVLHLASFAVSSFPVALWHGLVWRPDAVLTVAPTFFCAPGAWAAARLGGSLSWLHFQDFELDVAFNLGLLPWPKFFALAKALETRTLRLFDRLSTISERMVDRLRQKSLSSGRVALLPNWVDTEAIRPLDGPNALRAELGVPAGAVVALYSGSMGAKQGLELLLEAAFKAARRRDVLFVLCGEGSLRRSLEIAAAGASNVRFLPLQPVDRLNELLNMADIHLLPQRESAADLVMPSKLSGMFASGRPVVTTAGSGTQLAQVVAGRGVVVPPGDAAALSLAVERLADDAQERARLGRAARQFALEHWSQDAVLESFERGLQEAFTERGEDSPKLLK